jgi:hypothetical protein
VLARARSSGMETVSNSTQSRDGRGVCTVPRMKTILMWLVAILAGCGAELVVDESQGRTGSDAGPADSGVTDAAADAAPDAGQYVLYYGQPCELGTTLVCLCEGPLDGFQGCPAHYGLLALAPCECSAVDASQEPTQCVDPECVHFIVTVDCTAYEHNPVEGCVPFQGDLKNGIWCCG